MKQGIDFLRLSRRKSGVHFANASICFPTFFLSGKNLPLFAYANRKKSPSLFAKDDTSSTAKAVPLLPLEKATCRRTFGGAENRMNNEK